MKKKICQGCPKSCTKEYTTMVADQGYSYDLGNPKHEETRRWSHCTVSGKSVNLWGSKDDQCHLTPTMIQDYYEKRMAVVQKKRAKLEQSFKNSKEVDAFLAADIAKVEKAVAKLKEYAGIKK